MSPEWKPSVGRDPREKRIAEFLTRPGEKFNMSEDILDAYQEVVTRVHRTDVYSKEKIEEAKTQLHDKFIAENPGTEMPIEELLKNLDVYNSPL